MAKRRIFQEKPQKEKTAKVEQHKIKVNNKQDKLHTKSYVSGDFFVKPTDMINIQDVQCTSQSLNTSNQSIKVGKSQVRKNKFEKHKQVVEKNEDVKDFKKPFDKKLFRLKKYSKKYKLEQWEEKRKKSLLREYHKTLKDENEPKLDVAKIYEDDLESSESTKELESNSEDNSKFQTQENPKKRKLFLKPHERFQKIKEEKEKKREEMMQRKAEREKAIKAANKERYERNKKLSQKTKKGQPIMRYRMEMLLEKIEKSLRD